MTFKNKLIATLLLVSLIPLTLLAVFNYINAKNLIESSVYKDLETTREFKAFEIEEYFKTISSQIISHSISQEVQRAALEYIEAFNKTENKISEAEYSSLKNYYENEFGKKYEDLNHKKINADELLKQLTPRQQYLQYAYISANPEKLGEKNNMMKSEYASEYTKIHKEFHGDFNTYLNQFGYYDIFIIDAKTGNVVYTVFKELDFATSLVNGPYKDTGLARAYKRALELEGPGDYAYDDFAMYYPSYESAAAFIASPVWKNGEKVAVLAYQMPISRINLIVNQRNGMGTTGEAYIIDSKGRLHNDLYTNQTYTIDTTFKGENKLPQYIVDHIKNPKDTFLSKNINEKEAIVSKSELSILGKSWYFFTDIETSEAFSALSKIKLQFLGFALVTIILVTIIGIINGNSLTNSISLIVERISKNAHEVQNSSQKLSMASEKLESSVELQASSIQETMSAIDEISAMSQNNSTSADDAKKLSEETKKTTIKGKDYVDEMSREIRLITESYSEISRSIEQNNQEILKIVDVINSISDKTKVINDIVFQTKLLSFNASVEAARAGEHGKGFAVVAEEVGNLASMSGNAAQEISQMLEVSIKNVQSIVSNMTANIKGIIKKGEDKIENGTKVSQICIEQLDATLAIILKLDHIINEVSGASGEQYTGISEINMAMQSLDGSINETSQMSSLSATSAESLHDQSRDLRDSVENLRKLLGTKKQKAS